MSISHSTIEDAVTELLTASSQLQRRLRVETNWLGLSWTALAVMGRLSRDGPMTTAELARAETMKSPSMASTLAQMEEEGLVERRPHSTDGRRILFALTKKGQEARSEAQESRLAFLANALAKLDDKQQENLIAAIDVIRQLAKS